MDRFLQEIKTIPSTSSAPVDQCLLKSCCWLCFIARIENRSHCVLHIPNLGMFRRFRKFRMVITNSKFTTAKISQQLNTSTFQKNRWKFNWKKESKKQNRLICKLVLEKNKSNLLCLISFEIKQDHELIHLVQKFSK